MVSFRNRISPGLRGALFYAFYWGVVGSFDPFIIVYFLHQGIDAIHIGWLAAVLPLCTIAIAPLVARLADRTRRRVILLASACLGAGLFITLPAVTTLFPSFRVTFIFLLGFIALFSVFRSPIISLADSLVAALSMRHNLEFGSMRLWGSLAFTLTASSLGLVWTRAGFPAMFLAAGIGVLPVVLAASLLDEAAPATPHESQPAGKLRPDRGVLFLLGATFLVLEGLFMAGTFIPVYITQLGGSEALVGVLNGISALGEVPGMLFGSRLARRLGETNALLVACALIAAGLAGYGLTRSPEVMLAFAALRGVGFGFMLVATVMIINRRAPQGLASTYQGMLNAAGWGLAPLLGGPLSGWLFQTYGPPTLFFSAAGLTLAATALIAPTYLIWREGKEILTAKDAKKFKEFPPD